MKFKNHFVIALLMIANTAMSMREGNHQQEPAPQQQVMQDYLGQDYRQKNAMRELLQERIQLARHHTAPERGLFKKDPDTHCSDRCFEVIESEEQCFNGVENKCNLTKPVWWATAVPAWVLGMVYDWTSLAVQCPVATSYACCKSECARKCYRERYEDNVRFRYAVLKD